MNFLNEQINWPVFFSFFYFIGGLLKALRINIVDENLFLIPFFLVFYEFYEDFNGEWRRICIFVRDDSVEKNYCKITFRNHVLRILFLDSCCFWIVVGKFRTSLSKSELWKLE